MPITKNSESCQISGVFYTKDWASSLGANWPALVGSFAKVNSLHIPDTVTFDSLTLAKESPARQHVEKYIKNRETAFGHPTKTHLLKGNWAQKILQNDKLLKEVLEDDINPPRICVHGVTIGDLVPISTLWYAVRCMKALPRLCEKSKVDQTPMVLDPYDVLHMCKFLANCYRTFKGKDIDEELTKKRNYLKILPKYADSSSNSGLRTSTASSANGSILPAPPSASWDSEALRRSLLGMEAFAPAGDFAHLQALGPDVPPANEKAVGELIGAIQLAVMRSRSGKNSQNPMSDDVFQILHDYTVNQDRDFSKDCILFEPAETKTRSISLNTNVAQTASIGEAIATAHDEDDENDAVDNLDTRGDAANSMVRKRGNNMSAATREFRDACDRAHLTVTQDNVYFQPKGSNKRVSLEPWQATAVAWMMDMEDHTPLHGGILADGCGLGKTRTTFSLMERSLANEPQDGKYYPQLILCPKSLVDMWYTEGKEQFGDVFTIKVFYGGPPKNPKSDREKNIIKNNAELIELLHSLSPTKKETAKVVIISTYDTFASRTTYRGGGKELDPIDLESDDENDDETPDAQIPPTSKNANDEDWLDFDTVEESLESSGDSTPFSDQGPTKSVRYALGIQGSRSTSGAIQGLGFFQNDNATPVEYVTRLKDVKFGRIICDEAHKVKSILSKQHQSISLVEHTSIWFLTATPMTNSLTDLNGPLSLLQKHSSADGEQNEAELPLMPGMKTKSNGGVDYLLEVYGNWSRIAKLPSQLPWGLLNPRLLVELQARRLTPAQACKIIPIIFRLCVLQRQMGDVIDVQGEKLRIGGKIPPARVMTVELCYPDEEQKAHDLVYTKVIKGFTSSQEDLPWANAQSNGSSGGKQRPVSSALADAQQRGNGRVNSGKLRRLCALAFHSKLDAFLNVESIANQYTPHIPEIAKEGNLCFELFWQLTADGTCNAPPRIRFDQAKYLLSGSPRLRYLLKIFRSEGLTPSSAKPRFVVFCNWPMTVWLVQMLLHALSLECVSITAPMSAAERSEAIVRFNDRNNNCSVFVTTYSLGAFGLNLQNSCSRLVLMESAINHNRIFHAIGRMHRLGQQEPQKIWYLFQDSTIQRWMDWNNLSKIRGQIAAQNREAFEPILQKLQEKRERDGISLDSKGERDGDLQDLCDRFFRDLMGQEHGCADRSMMWNEMDLDVVDKGRRHRSRRLGEGINNRTRAALNLKETLKAKDHEGGRVINSANKNNGASEKDAFNEKDAVNKRDAVNEKDAANEMPVVKKVDTSNDKDALGEMSVINEVDMINEVDAGNEMDVDNEKKVVKKESLKRAADATTDIDETTTKRVA
ncbi:SNF2-related protein [Penicillium verhagenii]|uniref:SNF2-related protein n=1 Tax=Penicillium verhagenii TaxID=1562060 RepID=UPI002545A8FC|nr:SNF2-related protein [Penicillium verhagenii]KAJ5947658.1 SNF2-related protein [Penicillium verhagenii]